MNETLWEFVQTTLKTSGGIERAVVIFLIVLSILSWTVIVKKGVDYYRAVQNGRRFLEVLRKTGRFGAVAGAEPSLGPSPFLSVFQAAFAALEASRNLPAGAGEASARTPQDIPLQPGGKQEEFVALAMQEAAQAEFKRLKTGLGLLGIAGSTSPFIGLFGTVWGIMNTFRSLGQAESATLAVVAPGIASALIATAAGLFVAIPAVAAYNWYLGQINHLQDESDALTGRLLALIRASGLWTAPAGSVAAGAPAVEARKA